MTHYDWLHLMGLHGLELHRDLLLLLVVSRMHGLASSSSGLKCSCDGSLISQRDHGESAWRRCRDCHWHSCILCWQEQVFSSASAPFGSRLLGNFGCLMWQGINHCRLTWFCTLDSLRGCDLPDTILLAWFVATGEEHVTPSGFCSSGTLC